MEKMETLTVAIFSDTYLPARDGVVTYIETLHSDIRQKCGGLASSGRKDQRFPLSILPGGIP